MRELTERDKIFLGELVAKEGASLSYKLMEDRTIFHAYCRIAEQRLREERIRRKSPFYIPDAKS
jgi:hypothetical protein